MNGETLVEPGGARKAIGRVGLAISGGASWWSAGAVTTVGSHPSCDVVIDDPAVSRFHCEVRIEGDRVLVRDTQSRNGTIVDGVEVIEARLRDGGELRVGRTTLRVTIEADGASIALSEHVRFGGLVGASETMRATFALLERAAASDATVLLGGETGTGKTACARSIHDRSARAGKPFVVVDLAAVPASLIESELFGHEKGAFTGADARRIGAFEEARGGTLLLDEVGELSLDLQPKLLRVLESREVRRVGGNAVIPVDVRLVAATHRDLRAEVNAGRFRPDLYYRLAVLRVTQPPLRERPDDIAPLAVQILAGLGVADPQVRRLLTPEMLERLRSAPWPGNVRELRNYLERCLVFDEPPPIGDSIAGVAALAPPGTVRVATDVPYVEARQRALRDFERVYVEELLDRNEAGVAAAAEAAGIDRTFLYRLLRRHGLKP